MQILLTSLKKGIVLSLNAGKVGDLGEIIIDPENAEILGFMLKTPILTPTMILSKSDIIGLDHHALIVNSPDSIVGVDEVIRIQKILPKRIKILNLKARTQSGEFLGVIEDIVLDSDSLSILKYYVRNLLTSRIFSYDKFVGFKNNTAIFTDDCSGPVGTPDTAPA